MVLGDNGEKLSKQNGAEALDLSDPLQALAHAAKVLGLQTQQSSVTAALAEWTAHTQSRNAMR